MTWKAALAIFVIVFTLAAPFVYGELEYRKRAIMRCQSIDMEYESIRGGIFCVPKKPIPI